MPKNMLYFNGRFSSLCKGFTFNGCNTINKINLVQKIWSNNATN